MKSQRHKPRGVGPEDLAAEAAVRKAARAYIRQHFPDVPRPSGIGWVFAPVPCSCPQCSEWLLGVSVPGINLDAFAYCEFCDRTFKVEWLKH